MAKPVVCHFDSSQALLPVAVRLGRCCFALRSFATIGTDYRMSLKAKLEAVIYAAEEPVTLTQLAALFAAEALEWKAAQETALVEQAASANTVVDPTRAVAW